MNIPKDDEVYENRNPEVRRSYELKEKRYILREKWEDWMTDGEGIEDGVAKEPSHKMVAEWLVEAYTTMPEVIGKNAWMKDGFKWF